MKSKKNSNKSFFEPIWFPGCCFRFYGICLDPYLEMSLLILFCFCPVWCPKVPCLINNLGLVAELHLQQSSDLLGHQVQKSFLYSRDLWKTNDKRPLVIQSPYISHQYYLKHLQSSDLLDQWIQKSFEISGNLMENYLS